MMLTSKPFICVVAAATLSGCATPKVMYTQFTQDNVRTSIDSYADTYMLAKSVLDITLETDPDTGEEIYRVNHRRTEDSAQSFGVSPLNRYGVTTRISLVKLDNTQIVQSAIVSVEDNRREYVEKAFKVLSSLSGLGVFGAPGDGVQRDRPVLPASLDTLEALERAGCTRGACTADLPSMAGLDAALTVSAVPPDAIAMEDLSKLISKPQEVLFSSACRQATFRASIDGVDGDLVARFALADPRFVQLIRLPYKGSITAHSECGYSVVPEEVELVSNLDLVDTFLGELANVLSKQKE